MDILHRHKNFLACVFFDSGHDTLLTCVFFSNSLNEKRMNGRAKLFGKKDRSPCLFKSKYPFFSLVSLASYETRSHNRGRRPQARGPRKTIEKDKCAIFSENCATLSVINSRGYTQVCVGLGDSPQARLRLDSKTRHMLSTKALINPSK